MNKYMVVSALFITEIIQISSSETFSNEWIIKTSLSEENLRRVASRYGFKFGRQLIDDKYLLIHRNITRSSKRKEHLMTKVFESEQKIEYAEQLVWRKRGLRGIKVDDEKWSSMWYMNSRSLPSMNVLEAWEEGYNGTGITIAIVDDGVEHTHDDLKDRYNPGLSKDFYDDDDDPSPESGNSHGTKCAGIALATKNKKCVIGVAFQATLAGHRMIGQLGATQAGEISALASIKDIDILSNSWGGDDLTTYEGPTANVAKALETGCKKGRSGKGAIYVFAGGNGGSDDNCNCDGFVNSIHTIAINSVSIDNQPPGYAEPCSAILASTYSGPGAPKDNICTTNIGNGCTEDFTGTSASTPMAAGVFAILLQANPNLTWRDVQELVVKTSKSAGLRYGKFKKNGVARNDTYHVLSINNALIAVSDFFGYGMLDSKALIRMGKSWKTLPEQHHCFTPVLGDKVENKKIHSNTTPRVTGGSIYTNGCNQTSHCVNRLEHVAVTVTFRSSLRGAVSLTLESPRGTVSNILTERKQDKLSGKTHRWTYMSVQYWGENPVGEWKLNMSLQSDWRQNGTLVSWKLTLYGIGEECSIATSQEHNEDKKDTILIILIIIAVVAGIGVFSCIGTAIYHIKNGTLKSTLKNVIKCTTKSADTSEPKIMNTKQISGSEP